MVEKKRIEKIMKKKTNVNSEYSLSLKQAFFFFFSVQILLAYGASLVDFNVEIFDDDVNAELGMDLPPSLLPSSLFLSLPHTHFFFIYFFFHNDALHACFFSSGQMDRSGFDVSTLYWCIDLIQTNWQNRESGLVLRGIPEHRQDR